MPVLTDIDICQPARSMVYVLVVMIPNVLTDIYLLSIPLPLLWAVRIGLRRKITLMALFSGAIFVAVAAIVRAVIVIVVRPPYPIPHLPYMYMYMPILMCE